MIERPLDEYRRRRAAARAAFSDLVETLNRRDTCDLELAQSRHPLPTARVEFLTDKSRLAHHRTAHLQNELDDYAAKLTRLARELQRDEFEPDDERGDGARRAGLRRTGDVGPATRASRGAAADAPQQQRLFA